MSLPIYFAPLQGYTEDAYRRVHKAVCGGIDEYYTPFLRLEQEEIRKKDNLGLRPEHNVNIPLAIQVIARSGVELKLLLNGVQKHVKEWHAKMDKMQMQGVFDSSALASWPDSERIHIDINMGCPFPLQVDHGRGAGLLANPDKVQELCEVMQSSPEYDFSVKMRLGIKSPDEWKGILPILNQVKLKHITLHPRVAKQMYTGTPNLDAFEEFAAECRHPLVYNGDIRSVEDVDSICSRFPALEGLMIGRGLLSRPTLANEIKTGKIATHEEVVAAFKAIHEGLYRYYAGVIPGEEQLLLKLQSFWAFSEQTFGRRAWKKVCKAGNMRNYLRAVDEL